MYSGGLELYGPLIGERLDELPLWQASDEARLVYSNTTKKYYYGTSSGWKDMSGAGDAFLDADTLDGYHASGDARPNTILALDANSQLPASADMLDGKHASTTPVAGTIPVYDSNAKVPGNITGDADTVDGKHAASFVKTDENSTIDGHTLVARGSSGQMNVASGSTPSIEVRAMNPGTEPAMIMFSKPGVYSTYLGIDADNGLKFGGLSEGTNVYKIWNEKNDGAGSGLDADKVDGFQTSFTASASAIPVLNSAGKLDITMIPSSGLPVGSFVQFPVNIGTGIFSDWISCRGQSLAKADYPDLYAAIGDRYGNADSDHFYIPDCRGRFFRMIDAGKGLVNSIDENRRVAAANGSVSTPGSTQTSATYDHAHSMFAQTQFTASGSGTMANFSTAATYSGNTQYTAGLLSYSEGGQYFPSSLGGSAGWGVNYISEYETRPFNIYVEVGIKWR